jgi:hypothetical protein
MFKAIDAWILYVLRSGNEKDATIKNIISVIDYLDHSIPNYSELDESLRRLSMIGLITWNPPGIQATPSTKNGAMLILKKEKGYRFKRKSEKLKIISLYRFLRQNLPARKFSTRPNLTKRSGIIKQGLAQ